MLAEYADRKTSSLVSIEKVFTANGHLEDGGRYTTTLETAFTQAAGALSSA